MWDVVLNNLPAILTAAIGLALVWKYVGSALAIVKELQELLKAVIVALADRKLSQEEIDTIIAEGGDLIAAIKELLNKKDS